MNHEQFRHVPSSEQKDVEVAPILTGGENPNLQNFVIEESTREDSIEAGDHMERSVEQTMLRNNVFFVHTINENPALRHNENSNVSQEATFEDDLDILLALGPSVSASSVAPGMDEDGMVSGLWSKTGGVLISRGHISAASVQDIGTVSRGIQDRTVFGEANQSVEEIDAVIQNANRVLPDEIGGYNELVINNPEVSGYFSPGEMDTDGRFWAYGIVIRKNLERLHELYQKAPNGYEYRDELELFQRNIHKYQNRFNQVKERDLPFYVMTPERRFFEVVNVNENGSLTVGEELTAEQAANGQVALEPEKRKEIGRRLIAKGVFRDQNTQQEASDIIENL